MTIQVGGCVYETSPQAVKPKQQSINFDEDFSCPITEEWYTVRTPDTNGGGQPSTAAIPVVVTLNRKGVIDSEPIASGQILLPVEASAMENLSVGLFPVEDERTEIAIAKVSVELSVIQNDEGLIAQILNEIERVIKIYVNDKAVGLNVTDSLQRFASSVTPVRRAIETTFDLFTWKTSYTRSWLFLVTSMLFYPIGLIIAALTLLASSFETPITGLNFIAHRIHPTIESADESVEKNVMFLLHIMDRISNLSDYVSALNLIRIAFHLVALWAIPLNWVILIVMTLNTFAVQGIVQFVVRKKSRMTSQDTVEARNCVVIVENQRWWLGKWSNRLIGSEGYPWTDITGLPRSKETVQLPPGYRWDGTWKVDLSRRGDAEGWVYGRDFKQDLFHSKRELGQFVRSRRWLRSLTPEPVDT